MFAFPARYLVAPTINSLDKNNMWITFSVFVYIKKEEEEEKNTEKMWWWWCGRTGYLVYGWRYCCFLFYSTFGLCQAAATQSLRYWSGVDGRGPPSARPGFSWENWIEDSVMVLTHLVWDMGTGMGTNERTNEKCRQTDRRANLCNGYYSSNECWWRNWASIFIELTSNLYIYINILRMAVAKRWATRIENNPSTELSS